MPVCKHPWDDLTLSITGVRCRSCNASDTGIDAVFFRSLQEKVAAMDQRFDQIERAVSRAGLTPCERCGEWYGPRDPRLFRWKSEGGILALCPACVCYTLQDEDDTTRFAGADGDWRPGVTRALVRWAFALPKSEYRARVSIEIALPNEVRQARSA